MVKIEYLNRDYAPFLAVQIGESTYRRQDNGQEFVLYHAEKQKNAIRVRMTRVVDVDWHEREGNPIP